MVQDDVFLADEGNAWFQRNRDALGAAAQVRHDWPLTLIGRLDEAQRAGIGSVVELGCSNGWRLARLGKTLPARMVGVDASAEAVADGEARYPGLRCCRAGLADVPLHAAVRPDHRVLRAALDRPQQPGALYRRDRPRHARRRPAGAG